MPAGSEKLTAARREEILDACAQLYEIMPFKKITHAMISQKTSFTRTSIYNYFRTKEEIFLALLEREYAEWVADLNALAALDMPREEFPSAFSALLEKRKCMLKLMSMNLLLPAEDTPVIWRGPIIANIVKQFWTDVIWGDLDYLLVDMPPGTGDVPLTVFQSLPVNEIVVVTSPQDLVQMIVKKAVSMAEQMKIPVKGVVENYSYLQCPDCGKKLYPFGQSHLDEIAGEEGLKVLGRIPLDPAYAEAADKGAFDTVRNPWIEAEF